MKQLYEKVLTGRFVERPNRFVVHLAMDHLNGEVLPAHLPNPGRMWELLYPGVKFYIVHHPKKDAKTQYRVIGIERDGVPIMLDTNYSNDVAEYLISTKQIPGWEEWSVVRREYTVGNSRFDLLLTNDDGESFLLEVKSCTLFSREGAMFPDAITERGRKHLLHLQALKSEGYHTGVLFLVQWERARWFLPDYHTDLAFAQTFGEVAGDLDWKAVALRWTEEFTMPEVIRECRFDAELLAGKHRTAAIIWWFYICLPPWIWKSVVRVSFILRKGIIPMWAPLKPILPSVWNVINGNVKRCIGISIISVLTVK